MLMYGNTLKIYLNNYNQLKNMKNMTVLSLFSFKMDGKLKLNSLLQKTTSFYIPASHLDSPSWTQQILLA